MPNDEEIREAERLLDSFPEYRWLTTSDKQWWTVAEVSDGLGVSKDVVRAVCERGEMPGAVLYAQQVGWRIPRSGLVVFCARQQGWNAGQQNAG